MTLWTLLLAGWACAGSFETGTAAVRPVQLSLELPQSASATRFEAIEAISQVPGAAAVADLPPALPAAAMPQAVAAALRSGDAASFYEAALESGYQPPESDDHQLRLLDEGAARWRAEQDFHDAVANRLAPKTRRKAKFDDAAFGRALAKHPGLSSDPFKHAAAKREILRAAGYTHLRAGRRGVSLDQASDKRVGEAFAERLRAHRRR